jgi:MOSC domain-containing protein YiiM
MKVISVNRGKAQSVVWRGKQVETGIFKYPMDGPIFLGTEDVAEDAVVD